MSTVDHGIFTTYVPTEPLLAPDGQPAWHLRNEAGIDFYDLTASLPEGATLVEVLPDSGNVFGFTGRDGPDDYRTIWPVGRRVLEVRPVRTDLMGLRWDGADFAPAPPPIPPTVSRTQIAQGFAQIGVMSEADAEEWVGANVLPSALVGLIAGLPAAEQFPARLKLRGDSIFRYDDPLMRAVIGLAGGDPTQFWRNCAAL